jgi:hypothetical protein
MELKRYVQIRKEIFELEEILYNSDNYVQFKAVNENHKRTIYKGDGYKNSDNILDLVEVGDLVEDKYNNILKVESVFIDSDGDKEYYCIFDTWQEDEITAIYKLQPNGDYKRYEVKE